jgi:hypothetical protein
MKTKHAILPQPFIKEGKSMYYEWIEIQVFSYIPMEQSKLLNVTAVAKYLLNYLFLNQSTIHGTFLSSWPVSRSVKFKLKKTIPRNHIIQTKLHLQR